MFILYTSPAQNLLLASLNTKFTHHKSPHSLIGMEIPSKNGKHYPLPMKRWQTVITSKYHQLQPENVFSIGRAGSYRYEVDIDDCIRQAMDLVASL